VGPRLSPLELPEREAMVRALVRSGGRVDAAARSLGLSRATLYRRIRRYRIDLAAYAGDPVSD
jgi:transcriptional regulator of acetoin/glycerol metabolism